MQVISGEVGTNILKNDVNRKLPEGMSLSDALLYAKLNTKCAKGHTTHLSLLNLKIMS